MTGPSVQLPAGVSPHAGAYYLLEQALTLISTGQRSAELTLGKRKIQEAMSWIEWHERETASAVDGSAVDGAQL